MPFTFSHPAIVLPLTFAPRQWFSLTGLMVGSLTPDFEYFLRMRIQSSYSHTISGLFWFNLPLGLLIAFIFHNLVRNSLFDNLPIILKSRFSIFAAFDWPEYLKKNWHIVTISLLIGSASHIFWDSFTHEHGYFVEIIPSLRNTLDLFGGQISIFKILQHSSTLLGGLVIVTTISKLPQDKSVSGQLNLKYWGILTVLTLSVIVLRILSGLDYNQYGHLIVTSISAGLISVVMTPIINKWVI